MSSTFVPIRASRIPHASTEWSTKLVPTAHCPLPTAHCPLPTATSAKRFGCRRTSLQLFVRHVKRIPECVSISIRLSDASLHE